MLELNVRIMNYLLIYAHDEQFLRFHTLLLMVNNCLLLSGCVIIIVKQITKDRT
jgi:hypothetical protein